MASRFVYPKYCCVTVDYLGMARFATAPGTMRSMVMALPHFKLLSVANALALPSGHRRFPLVFR